MTKTCTRCGKEYPEPFSKWFYRCKREKDGFSYTCKACERAYRHSESGKKYLQKYNKSSAGKTAIRKYRSTRKGKITARDNYLQYNHGISFREYNLMFHKQKGCCLICGRHQNETKHRLAVDHNHQTGKIRGLLCFNCNTGLGNLQDSKELLQKAIKYLEENNG